MSTLKRGEVYLAYAQSLLWAAFFMAVVVGVLIVVEFILVDFVHINPRRTEAGAAETMVSFFPTVGMNIINILITFALPQCFQGAVSEALTRRLGRKGQLGILPALPLTAVLAWYSHEYLAPIVGLNSPTDVVPSTIERYLPILVFQTAITLFSLAYADAVICRRSRKSVILPALAFAVAIGVACGYGAAKPPY